VSKDGKILSVKNVNKLGFGCEEEATRLVKEGPLFIGARNKGVLQ